MKRTDIYTEALICLRSILQADHPEFKNWIDWLERDIQDWNQRREVAHHLRAYGGMGSFNDLPNTRGNHDYIFGFLKSVCYVDINNCPFAPQLLNRGFAKDTGLYKESGFCSYPLWTFDETVLKETGGEKYERYARAYDEYMESSFIGMMGAEDETGEEICTGMMM